MKYLLPLFAAFFLLASSQLMAQDWTKYKSKDPKVKVKFPSSYEVKEQDKSAGNTTKISTKWEDILFYVSYTEHNQEMPEESNDHLETVSLDAFAEQVGGEPQNLSEWEVKKHTGQKMFVQIDGGKIIQYHVVIIGQVQYQVVAAYDSDDNNQAVISKFLKSFKAK